MGNLLFNDYIENVDRETAADLLCDLLEFVEKQRGNIKPDAIQKIAEFGELFCGIIQWDYQKFYYDLVGLEKQNER